MAEYMDFEFRLDHVQHILPRVKNPQEWHEAC